MELPLDQRVDRARVRALTVLEQHDLLSPSEVSLLDSCHQQVWDGQELSPAQRRVVDLIVLSRERRKKLGISLPSA